MNANKEKEAKLTQEELKELLIYDKDSGEFTWIKAMSSRAGAGSIAGCVHQCTGYRVITIAGTQYKEHRLAFLYVTGKWPSDQVDHINGYKVDNRWGNLRDVTAKENSKNKKIDSRNTSGFVGVGWHKQTGKWRVRILVNNVRVSLGSYFDLENAIQARKIANIKYGYHQNHGRQVEEI